MCDDETGGDSPRGCVDFTPTCTRRACNFIYTYNPSHFPSNVVKTLIRALTSNNTSNTFHPIGFLICFNNASTLAVYVRLSYQLFHGVVNFPPGSGAGIRPSVYNQIPVLTGPFSQHVNQSRRRPDITAIFTHIMSEQAACEKHTFGFGSGVSWAANNNNNSDNRPSQEVQRSVYCRSTTSPQAG